MPLVFVYREPCLERQLTLGGRDVIRLLLAIGLVSAGAAVQAQSAAVAVPSRADTTFTPTGIWRCELAPHEEWMIVNLLPQGGFCVTSEGGLQSVGFFDRGAFEGPARVPDGEGLAPDSRGSVLRFRRTGEERIEAAFFRAMGEPAGWRGTFVRTSRTTPDSSRSPASRRRSEAARHTDRLPGPEEFVYVETLPAASVRVPPLYPEGARMMGISGTVMVKALVDRDGRVVDTRIQASIVELDAAALEAVRQWRFVPATAKGAPVAVWVSIPVKFTLR